MRLALYVTCLVDLMRPAIGFAALRLNALASGLRSLGIVIEHRHLRARQGKRLGHTLPNAIAPTGHHRCLVTKIKHTGRLK